MFGEVTSKVGNIGRKLRLSELLVEHLMKIPEIVVRDYEEINRYRNALGSS